MERLCEEHKWAFQTNQLPAPHQPADHGAAAGLLMTMGKAMGKAHACEATGVSSRATDN